MNREEQSLDFSLSELTIAGKSVPILLFNGKLVVFPSRYSLHLITEGNASVRYAKTCLRKIVQLARHRWIACHSETPDQMLISVDDKAFDDFFVKGKGGKLEHRAMLLAFYRWLRDSEQIELRMFS